MRAPRVMIAAPSSGSGKTMMTCGLLSALISRGLRAAAFKCGPDYIDPMFHRRVIGAPSSNIDLFFGGIEDARSVIADGARDADISIIEGVMGFYDGMTASTSEGSSHDIAAATGTPVILVVDAAGQSISAAASLLGFLRMREPSGIAGVIFNRMSERVWPSVRVIAEGFGVQALGYVPRDARAAIDSRHLGLITPDDIPQVKEKLAAAEELISRTVDIDGVIELARTAPDIDEPRRAEAAGGARARIALASDEAFCFVYEQNIRLLESMGAEIVRFSPLRSTALPDGAQGMILCGGYPELRARELSENESMRRAVRRALEAGMPCLAECGGFMYLHDELVDPEGRVWPMAGAIRGSVRPAGHLVRFGYASLTAGREGLLLPAGTEVRGHEFHTYESTDCGADLTARRPDGSGERRACHAGPAMIAGFPHLYYPSAPELARGFLEAASIWRPR